MIVVRYPRCGGGAAWRDRAFPGREASREIFLIIAWKSLPAGAVRSGGIFKAVQVFRHLVRITDTPSRAANNALAVKAIGAASIRIVALSRLGDTLRNVRPGTLPRDPSSWQSRSDRLMTAAKVMLVAFILTSFALAQNGRDESCPRAAPGSLVSSPQEIKSSNGVLAVALSLRNEISRDGQLRYCYVDQNGNLAPTLRVNPGDLLILNLKNELVSHSPAMKSSGPPRRTPCLSWDMQSASTNLHFHGLMIPPSCHEDDVLNTLILPGLPAYEYRVRIPRTQPPGLYWYHPHPHGHSEEQVLGGASGALIVEGIERFHPELAGLPERLLVIRDQTRTNVVVDSAPKPPSKDLSVNYVPVPYPDYPPSIIKMRPSQRELWRVLNASADTFLDLHLLTNGRWQTLGLVSLDGVPLGYEQVGEKGSAESDQVHWTLSIPLPPGGRAEFLFDGPPQGGWSQLLTAGVDTVPVHDEDDPTVVAPPANTESIPDDDYTPPRWIVKIVAEPDAPQATDALPRPSSAVQRSPLAPLKSVHPRRTRSLYFSEKVLDPENPRASTVFYLTEEGHRPAPFDPTATPNITVRQGDVEDWILENRSQEAHTFHIHQTHFIVLERENSAVAENYLRDTVELPYWDGVSPHYPSVKLRMDFRDPAIVGTFPYHCHILQHEDGGMMGTIRVRGRSDSLAKK